MDAYDYITNPGLVGSKLYRLREDSTPQPRRYRQRDVDSKGHAVADIQRTMGQSAGQSKYTGESFEECALRLCGYDTPEKVAQLEGKPVEPGTQGA